ncbi:MAG TPA: exopolysaccharide biosynthesis polyprenyl glycosylphosphotransferase [Candidatus Atribacteria bacterium]|nr:exopolysaccharide biosynthesis polyprenyl glycosylphosphotransferase [Candidatus Atribacteria bacterium]
MTNLLKNPTSRKKFLIFVGDVLLIALSILVVIFLVKIFQRYYLLRILKRPLKFYPLWISAIVYLIALYIFEMYEIRRRQGKLYIFTSFLLVSFICFLVMFSLAKILRINQTTMVVIFLFFISSAFFLFFWRWIFMKIFLGSGFFKKNVLFVGKDSLIGEILKIAPSSDYKIFIEDPPPLDVKKIDNLIASSQIDIIVTPFEEKLSQEFIRTLYNHKLKGIEIYDSEAFYEILTRKFPISHYLAKKEVPYIGVSFNPLFRNFKRMVDIAGAFLLLLILFPLFLVIFILINLTSGKPVFFIQERLGLNQKPFKLVKFRTMIKEAESQNGPQWASKNDERVTKLGRFLRRFRLDELPQLINVLRGDLSFVGPRPIRRYFADLIEEKVPFYSLRFTVKPGLTGWAQVHYDYGGSIEGHIEKFQYDLYYIKRASLFLDLFIILKTLQTIIRRPGY